VLFCVPESAGLLETAMLSAHIGACRTGNAARNAQAPCTQTLFCLTCMHDFVMHCLHVQIGAVGTWAESSLTMNPPL
jgi:hypothetical protein